MNQYKGLIDTLKQLLKAYGLTYAQIAEQLDLSEASVKRMFSLKEMSLARLEELCSLIDIDIAELVKSYNNKRQQTVSLTLEQEQQLVADKELLLMIVCLMNFWTVKEIRNTYQLGNVNKLLNKLDAMKVIEVLPNDRTKLLISHDFKWIKNGPIQQFFNQQIQQDFLQTGFTQDDEIKLFRVGMLSPESRKTLIKKLEKVAQEFNDIHEADSHLPLGERNGSGILLAVRAWEFSAFNQMRKDNK